jgi:hypothetical protein
MKVNENLAAERNRPTLMAVQGHPGRLAPCSAGSARGFVLAGMLLIGALTVQAAESVVAPKIGDRLPAVSAPSRAGALGSGPAASVKKTAVAASGPTAKGFRLIDWDALLPIDWDPLKDLKALQGLGMAGLKDGDPRAQAALDALRQAWDHAPTVPGLAGQKVRIAGYVVPLDGTPQALHEFLLVPYFGACIHTPPPPANQIIHVVASPPARGFKAMDAAWVDGTISLEASDTAMGASGYRLDAASVSVYR